MLVRINRKELEFYSDFMIEEKDIIKTVLRKHMSYTASEKLTEEIIDKLAEKGYTINNFS